MNDPSQNIRNMYWLFIAAETAVIKVYPVIFAPCSGRLHGDSHPLPEPSACNAEQYVSADIISLVDLDSDAGCRVHGNCAVLCNVILPVRLNEKRARPVAMLSGVVLLRFVLANGRTLQAA